MGLFMHLIPTWILLIVLVLSRKRYPIVGAIVFTLFGVRYTITNIITFIMSTGTGEAIPYYLLTRPLIITLPALAVG